MKLPAFQFYPADWRKDPGVQALDFHTRGIWFEILCIMHESSERGVLLLNGAPMPEEALARMLGLDKQILTTGLTMLLTYGVVSKRPEDGALVSRRMVRDENIRKVRADAGKKGGNPVLLKQILTTGVKQIPTPSSSSSSSDTQTQRARFEDFWTAYPKKTGKGAALRSWMRIRPSIELFGTIMSALAAIKTCEQWAVRKIIPNPATWLNQGRWDDSAQIETPKNKDVRLWL